MFQEEPIRVAFGTEGRARALLALHDVDARNRGLLLDRMANQWEGDGLTLSRSFPAFRLDFVDPLNTLQTTVRTWRRGPV